MRTSNTAITDKSSQPNPQPNIRSTLRGHLDLLDPVTWAAGPQGFISGAIASGGMKMDGQTLWLTILGLILVGPLTIGFSQSINDFFDREVDAVNEPTRPIPAGLVTLRGAILNFSIVALLAFLVSVLIATTGGQNGLIIIVMTILGLLLGVFYSMPPLEFKRNGLSGPLSVGLGYNLLTWMAGLLIFGPFKTEVLVVAVVNAFIAIGLIIMNDLKGIDGDREHGVRTLPVMYGARGALRISYLFIDISQAAFTVYMFATGHIVIAIVQLVALLAQMYAQRPLYANPTHSQYKVYLLSGNGLIALVALLSALSFGGYQPFNGW
jgi:bacteriochlorophyll/chlorophyll synthetase